MLKIKVYAKINLSLDITGVREDGYHTLDMVMTSISLADSISLEKRQDGDINIFYENGEKYPDDLAKKAGEMLVKKYGLLGADITITKRIPEKCGLGGSSADASGVIFGLAKLNNYDVDDIDVKDVINIGSDVYYMMYGGVRRVFGVGEVISTAIESSPMNFILLTDNVGVDTRQSYQNYQFGYNRFDNRKLTLELVRGNIRKASEYFKNALYDSSRLLNEDIDRKISILSQYGADGVFMTGSGSGVVGYFTDKNTLENAYDSIKLNLDNKFEVFCVNSCNNGIEILE